jgi:2,4-dienoyl-CoA reductase-like NADH-dependent reductase (Old Yellow Enzyme family)
VASLAGTPALRARLDALGVTLPCDDEALPAPGSPLAAPRVIAAPAGAAPRRAPNRFAIQPMEGWDGTPEGAPSALTTRRWRGFGRSGAGLVWGGEAVAVAREGRANPSQLVLDERTAPAIGRLRAALCEEAGGVAPVIGLQLTHSGRWSRPDASGARPRVAFRHALLDRRVGLSGDEAVMTDADLRNLVLAFATASRLAEAEGFDFVDVKHCHGYLLHELLAARGRAGDYGGPSLEARMRFLREVVGAVRQAAPRLLVGLRLSIFDRVPHRAAPQAGRGPGPGQAEPHALPYLDGFGVDADDPAHTDWSEPLALVAALPALGVTLLNVTAGSPYYVPHVQRPAAFPPSDGYASPEDPLVGVARLLDAARRAKEAAPGLAVVASGLSYLQEYVPHVAQACVRAGHFDFAGLGRMALSYPELPADVLAGRPLVRERICRTFSDCTTAPRSGLISGCYPLDPFYRAMPEREELERRKRAQREGAP